MLAALLLAAAAVFTYDATRNGLWANLALGLVCFSGLLFLIHATYGLRPAKGLEPARSEPELKDDLKVLLDQSPVPLVRYSSEEGPVAVNRSARALFQTDNVIVSGSDELIRAMTEQVLGSRAILTVFDRQYAVSVSETMTADGATRLASLTDVQVEMHKAEAAALRDTLQILSHEIMNSLTPVSSLADIADEYLADTANLDVPSAREALDTLSQRAKSLTRFIEAYRSVARLPEPSLQPVEPGRVVTNIMELFRLSATNSEVNFHLEIEENLPTLQLDEAQIGQAIINVVTNALEATEGLAGMRRVTVSAFQSHQNVVVRISDNGEGVAESIKRNLFSAFATTKAKGTGTGLNLARQIVLAHGGNLQLLEEPGGTLTTFAFTFPVQ
jgi:signal transduction histidine kinase